MISKERVFFHGLEAGLIVLCQSFMHQHLPLAVSAAINSLGFLVSAIMAATILKEKQTYVNFRFCELL